MVVHSDCTYMYIIVSLLKPRKETMVGTECDDAVFPSHFRKVHTRNFFFDLKDKHYKKAKIKGGVGQIKK